ncbi:MAG: MBL fold metallo-hydrolase [Pirellulales bacterium]|nr:MBL fold metallo-hydrolase [Pirellulales bacterium]
MLVKDPPVEITEGLWMLGTSEYPLYVYHGGGEYTIFEGGIGAVGPILAEQFEALGIAGQSVARIVVTHAHPDHVMAVPAFRQMFPQATVVASEIAAKTLAVEKAVAFFAKMDQMLAAALIEHGLIREQHRAVPPAENRIAVDRSLHEGDTLEVGAGKTFQVFETPGHSDCSLSFFEPVARILVVSDATGYYMPRHGAWWPNYFTDYGKYVASMERLAGLDAEILCLSHNGAVRGADEVAAYFRGAIEATRAYHQRILDEFRSGSPVRQIAETLGAEIHAKMPLMPLDFFQKNCGLLVKLSLAHKGIDANKPA